MSDEELDILYEAVAPDVDAGVTVRELARQVAAKYRVQNKVPPDHVLACQERRRWRELRSRC